MNYIRHLNAFFQFVRKDERLACSHVSLYLALFQYWNFNRFQNPFPVTRESIMQLSRLGSKNTYHKAIRHLNDTGYIIYHPPPTKFQAVKISMIRLDIKEEQQLRYRQLDLFSTNNDIGSVPKMTGTSPNTDTDTVSKLGHSINNKLLKNESKQLPQRIFEKKEGLSNKVNSLAGVPNSVHYPSGVTEVEEFFSKQKYPIEEARKFFNHYKAIGWKIKGVTPIEDWHAAAHKWMLNAGKYQESKPTPPAEATLDLKTLHEMYKEGKKIFYLITEDHFTELNLQLTPEIMELARLERMNQLTGSNQNSILQLLQAYLNNRENDPVLLKDKANLIILAKRIGVQNHFKQ